MNAVFKPFHMAFSKNIILVFVFFISINLSGQIKLSSKNRSAIKDYNSGVSFYGAGKKSEASSALISALTKDPNFIEAYLVLGDLYHSQDDHKKEVEILKKAVAIDSTFFPTTYLNIGIAAYLNADYEESILWLERYKWRFSDDRTAPKVNMWLERVRFAEESVNNQYNIQLYSAGDSINSEFDEYWPSLTADEQTMIFTVLVPRNLDLFYEKELPKSAIYFQEDFYYSTKEELGWLKRKELGGAINTDGNEGAQTLSADGNWMFFTACGRQDGRGSCDIYFSERKEEGWSEPVNLGMPVNTPYWESQPSFSSDGKTLLFVSNRPGGVGGKDIWEANIQDFKKDGTPIFGNVRCLGTNINTNKDENSPFLHHDNKTLYFSSNGRPGMGEMDIFFSRRGANGEWKPPVNLGYPINTSGDEIGFVVNAKGNRAYFSSDGREEFATTKNIYWFDLPAPLQPEPVIYVKGRVYDFESKETLAANFQLQDLVSGADIVTTKGNRSTGEFLVCLPLGNRYSFRVSHPGFLFYSGHFDIKGDHPLDAPFLLDVALHPIKQGAKTTLKNIFFEVDSYELRSDSKIELNGLIEFMKDNKDVKIQIGGHTDNQGKASYNQLLSESRAKEVRNYLIMNGVKGDRVEFKGFGMNRPIDNNATEDGRANNRRTEITVL